MKKEDYHCSITANITAKEAMEGISRVSEWWVKSFEGSAQKLGDVFTIRFGEPSTVNFKITEYDAGKKVVWLVTNCYLDFLKDKTEWTNTTIIWELEEKNKATEIHFTHVGIVPGVECYDMCVKGWDQYVKGSLVKLLTEGKGAPS